LNAPFREFPSYGDGATILRPGKLWSLWDMINYQVFSLCHLLRFLRQEEGRFAMFALGTPLGMLGHTLESAIAPPQPPEITEQHKEEIRPLINFAKTICQQLEIQSALDRIGIFTGKMRFTISPHDFVAEIRVLRESIETTINLRYFYYYPQSKASLLLSFEQVWDGIIKAFPAVKADAHCAADLYALNHNTASVFHSMRVAEHGLRALAKERKIHVLKNRPIEWNTWQDILKAIGAEVETITKTKSAGAAKDRALEFYSGALADLGSFKDEYRNLVMHVRVEYDELQSLRAFHRVHDFMERLSAKIDHKHHRIRWGFK
jgi:hypothetical protein